MQKQKYLVWEEMFSVILKGQITIQGKEILYVKMSVININTKFSWKLSCLENSNATTPEDLRLSNEKWVRHSGQLLLLGNIMLQAAL